MLFCMPLLPVPKRAREEFEPRGVEPVGNLDDIGIGMPEVTGNLWGWGLGLPSSESWPASTSL